MHNPVVDDGADCINLSVTIGRLAFNGLVQLWWDGYSDFKVPRPFAPARWHCWALY